MSVGPTGASASNKYQPKGLTVIRRSTRSTSVPKSSPWKAAPYRLRRCRRAVAAPVRYLRFGAGEVAVAGRLLISSRVAVHQHPLLRTQ
jgi:hypothetical protein